MQLTLPSYSQLRVFHQFINKKNVHLKITFLKMFSLKDTQASRSKCNYNNLMNFILFNLCFIFMLWNLAKSECFH